MEENNKKGSIKPVVVAEMPTTAAQNVSVKIGKNTKQIVTLLRPKKLKPSKKNVNMITQSRFQVDLAITVNMT